MNQNQIYDKKFVQNLFDEMAATYGLVNLISSFGFCRRWRRQCVDQVGFPEGGTVVDLMTGMGELCPAIARRIGACGTILAVDNSAVMCAAARQYEKGKLECDVEIVEADALDSNLADQSTDVVISSFGLKTFSTDQIQLLAREVNRILKPGGCCSFIEISVPVSRWLRIPYLFYLSRVIPGIGRLFQGNPDNYRMLSVYTTAFQNCECAREIFERVGLQTERRSYFFGCATGWVGRKPLSDRTAHGLLI